MSVVCSEKVCTRTLTRSYNICIIKREQNSSFVCRLCLSIYVLGLSYNLTLFNNHDVTRLQQSCETWPHSIYCRWIVRLGSIVVQIGPKWTNSELFQIRFQYILARRTKMYWNLIWKSRGSISFRTIWLSDPLCA